MTLTADQFAARTRVPWARANFKAGFYDLDGTICALADLFVEATANPFHRFTYSLIVPGVGFHLEGVGAAGDQAFAPASPALLALIGGGFTMVETFGTQGYGTELSNFGVNCFDGVQAAGTQLSVDGHANPPEPPYLGLVSGVDEAGSWESEEDNQYYARGDLDAGVTHRLASTIVPGKISGSFNGRPAFILEPALHDGTGAIAANVEITLGGDNNLGGPWGVTIERVAFFPPVPDASLHMFSQGL